MIYPDSFEKKIGFAAVREMVANHCTSSLGIEYCQDMAFSTDFDTQVMRRCHWKIFTM